MSTDTLLSIFAVHCFFGSCPHVVRELDPHTASRVMQAHYDEKHVDDLTRLGYPPQAADTERGL